MNIAYCQKIRFPIASARALQTCLTARAFAEAGSHVRLFPGAPCIGGKVMVRDFLSRLGLDPLPETLSAPVIPTRHKGLYGLLFRAGLWSHLRRAPSCLCWAGSVKEAAMALALRPKGSGSPVVFEIHHLISRLKKGREAKRLYTLEKRVFEQADMVVFPCETLRKAAAGYLPEPRRSLVSPLGYNEHIIGAVRDPDLPEPAEETGIVRMVYVGSIQPGKGVERLVRALPLLPDNFALTIVGGGGADRVEAMRELAVTEGVSKRTAFTGRVEQRDLPSLLADCDIFVIPTTTENDFFAPIKMYEALGFGVPIVATPTPSLKERLKEGENALFSADASPEALARALSKLGRTPALRQAMRRANLACAKGLTTSIRARHLLGIFAQEFPQNTC